MRIRRRRRYTLALAIAACVLGMLAAIVALTLPFWADLEEDLAAPIALLAATLSATPLLHLSSHQTSSQSGPETHLFTAIATTGCGRPAPTRPGTTTVDRLSVGALTRDYRVHVPSTYQPKLKTALVLSLHGHGSTAVLQEQRDDVSHGPWPKQTSIEGRWDLARRHPREGLAPSTAPCEVGRPRRITRRSVTQTAGVVRPPLSSKKLNQDHLRQPLAAGHHREHVLFLIGDEIHEDQIVLAAERFAQRALDIAGLFDAHAHMTERLG